MHYETINDYKSNPNNYKDDFNKLKYGFGEKDKIYQTLKKILN